MRFLCRLIGDRPRPPLDAKLKFRTASHELG
jgi:hypothetical protein